MKILANENIKKEIKKLIKVLKIQNVEEIEVEVVKLPKGFNAGVKPTGDNKYHMIINEKLSWNAVKISLAHEMIHVHQMDRGDFEQVKETTGIHTTVRRYWMGEEISPTISYTQLPWEKEALSQMKIVAQAARKIK